MQDPESQKPSNPNKFIVHRKDGSSQPKGKHENCEFFVLDLMHDKFSLLALTAYVDACQAEYPDLAEDLKKKIKEVESRFTKTE